MAMLQNRRHLPDQPVIGWRRGPGWAFPDRPLPLSRRPRRPRSAFPRSLSACYAPLYLAEELLREEGFTEVRYVSDRPSFRLACWRMATSISAWRPRSISCP